MKYCKNGTLQFPGVQDKARNTGTGNDDSAYQKMQSNARSCNTDQTTVLMGPKGSQKQFQTEMKTKILK